MRMLFKEPGKEPRTMVIPNELDVMQQLVDGYIEHVTLREGLGILVNEEGKLKGMEANFYLAAIDDVIVGPCIFVGEDGDEFTDIPEDSMELIKALMEGGSDNG